MDAAAADTLHPLVRKLESIAPLSDEERHAIVGLPMMVRNLKADQDIVRDHDRPSQCCLILEGFACRYKVIEGGKRQIFSFHIPGDIPDLQSIHLDIMDHSLGTVVASKVAFIPHETVRAFIRAHPRIGDFFWRDTLIDAAIFREWMAGLGRREAYARIAHLFCELYTKFSAVGLVNGHAFGMPLTQAELGDALGLSTVHVNRTLQELRHNGLIKTQGGRVTIEDWDGLRAAGEFDPTYLHLQNPAPSAPGGGAGTDERLRLATRLQLGSTTFAAFSEGGNFSGSCALARVQSARPNKEAPWASTSFTCGREAAASVPTITASTCRMRRPLSRRRCSARAA